MSKLINKNTLLLNFSQILLIPLLMFLKSKLFSTYQILKGRLAKESRVIFQWVLSTVQMGFDMWCKFLKRDWKTVSAPNFFISTFKIFHRENNFEKIYIRTGCPID